MDRHLAQLIVGGIAAGGAGISMWFGWKNLEQAKILEHDLPPSRLEHNIGRAVTVIGTPTSLYAGHDPFLARALWFRKKFQQLERRYNSYDNHSRSRWRTVRTEESDWNLELDVGGVRVEVRNAPTEVYGTVKETSGGGWGEEYRTINEYLPQVPRLTVCGLLDRTSRGFTIAPHPKHGLLFAPEPPQDRAKKEALKGWLGLVGAPLAAAAGAAFVIGKWF